MQITCKRNFIWLIVLTNVLLLFGVQNSSAQAITDAEVKTAFVYNFIKYTSGKELESKSEVNFGYYGKDPVLINSLLKLQGKRVKGKTINVIRVSRMTTIPSIDFLFVFAENNYEIPSIYRLLKGNSIVLITDRFEEKREVMFNFIHEVDNKIQFELNSKNINESGFSVSPRLLLHGGTELDVRKLYKQTEATLASERERVETVEKELKVKSAELQKLVFKQDSLNSIMDNYQLRIKLQLDSIKEQRQNLQKITFDFAYIAYEAHLRAKTLDSTNFALDKKIGEIQKLDLELVKKQLKLENASYQIDTLRKQFQGQKVKIEGQSLLLREQALRIRFQNFTIIASISFMVLLLVFIFYIYRNYKIKNKKNIELEERNKKINNQNKQIQKQANQLRSTNLELEKLSVVAEKTDNAVIIMDANAEIEWVNAGFERITGYSAAEYFTKYGKSFIAINSEENASELINTCLVEKKSVSYNSYLITGKNNKIWLHTTITPILDLDNEIVKLVAIDTDITKIIEAEEKILKKNSEIELKAKELAKQASRLQKANDELEKQKNQTETAYNKLKEAQAQLVVSEKMASLGQLTSGVAHEINNPINYISSSIEGLRYIVSDVKLLLKEYDIVLEQYNVTSINKIKEELEYDDMINGFDELTSNIKMGVDRTKEIVNSLRTFSRLDNEEYINFNTVEGINSILILLGKELKGKVQIKRNFKKGVNIECLPGKINQVFMNILVNAIQAIITKGVITIEIDGVIRKDVEMAKIVITDTGIGMSKKTVEKIFEPFYTTKDVGKGTGLGMSISYNIVKNHNGEIEIKSEPDKGTSVIIYLPLKQT